MKAIILSAGQGKRLFPLTENSPKCLLSIAPARTLLGWQIDQLIKAGIADIRVVTGYRALDVASEIAHYRPLAHIETIFNEEFDKADNLVSVWKARHEMTGDFILLNGDTLFTADVARTLVNSPRADITVAISHKDRYDSDDMKVSLEKGRLTRIGKALPLDDVDGESIGMIRFSHAGADTFCRTAAETLSQENGRRMWYLSVIDALADSMPIATVAVPPSDWCEVDFPVDLQRARAAVAHWSAAGDSGEMELETARAS